MTQMKLKNALLLILTATIWGAAFVAQSVGMDYVGPFTFSATRSLLGGIVLIPVILIMGKKTSPAEKQQKSNKKILIIGGVCCGAALFAASNLQQIGIMYTSVGKAGFITACYIVLVPILGLFLKKKCSWIVWISVGLTLVGLYLLCINEQFSINKGDILMLFCALLFSVHILVIDHFAPKADGVKLSCIQFFVCSILSAICMFIFEKPSIASITQAWLPIAYAGVLSCGVAYTLQIIAQKGMNPTVCSLLLSLESCISVIAGWLILDQSLSGKEILGCVIMFAAIILAQIPVKRQQIIPGKYFLYSHNILQIRYHVFPFSLISNCHPHYSLSKILTNKPSAEHNTSCRGLFLILPSPSNNRPINSNKLFFCILTIHALVLALSHHHISS